MVTKILFRTFGIITLTLSTLLVWSRFPIGYLVDEVETDKYSDTEILGAISIMWILALVNFIYVLYLGYIIVGWI